MKPPRSASLRGAAALLLLLAGAAAADSMQEFLPPTADMLPVAFGQNFITTGQSFDASDPSLETTPSIFLPQDLAAPSSNSTASNSSTPSSPSTVSAAAFSASTSAPSTSAPAEGIIILLDTSVPLPTSNATAPSDNSTSPAATATTTSLLWLAAPVDLTLTPAEPADDAAGAPYVPPTVGAADAPHTLVFLLFAQSAGFAVPDVFAAVDPPAAPADRLNFDLAAFVAQAGLGQALAANYVVVYPPGGVPSGSSASSAAPSAPTGTGGAVVPPGNATAPVASGLSAPVPQPPAGATRGSGAGRVEGAAGSVWWGLLLGLLAALV